MTADGYKPVETIAVGDLVYSVNETTGAVEPKEVYGTYVGFKDELYTITTSQGAITATEEHPFWVVGKGWIEAKDLSESDLLKDAGGNGIAIQSIVHTSTEGTTIYNFSVTDNHNYFAGESNLLTHNINCADIHPRLKNMVDNAGKVDGTQFKSLLDDIASGKISAEEAKVIKEQLKEMAGGTDLFKAEIKQLDEVVVKTVKSLDAQFDELFDSAGNVIPSKLNEMRAAVKSGKYSLDEMKQLAVKFKNKNTNTFNGIKGDLGEGISDVTHKLKFPEYRHVGDIHLPGNKGFDNVYIKYADDGTVESVRIVESKYGSSKLGYIERGAEKRRIPQMSVEWVEDVTDRMRATQDSYYIKIANIVNASIGTRSLIRVLDVISKDTGEITSKILP